MARTSRRRFPRAFTLLEILVVATVAMLVGLAAVAVLRDVVNHTRRLRVRNLILSKMIEYRDRAVSERRPYWTIMYTLDGWETRALLDVDKGCAWGWPLWTSVVVDQVDLQGQLQTISGFPLFGFGLWDFCIEQNGYTYVDRASDGACVTDFVLTFRATGSSEDDVISIRATGIIEASWLPPTWEGLADVRRHGKHFTPINYGARVDGADCSWSPIP